jgi:glyoxylase-like metal-dependent hydrolase (beta-lactamase superfamily II)
MRWIARIGGSLFALGLLGLLVVLLPAHMQVRAVEPALPTEADLRALLSVPGGPVRIRYVNTSSQQLPSNNLGHDVFLVEWADGDLFMIDAGMDQAEAIQFGAMMQWLIDAEDVIPKGSVAELMGDDIARVKGVGFTHLHIDHTQGIVPFCEARGPGATLYQTVWQARQHNFNTEEGARLVANSCLEPQGLGGEGVMTIDQFPGLGVVALGGHTPGSTLFAVASQGKLWLFSGDTTNSKADLLDDRGKNFVYSTFLVPENTDRTAALRAWLRDLDAKPDIEVIVSHDLDALEASDLEPYARP